jgi:N-acetylmuramoyl-L-alanine amidase
MYRKPRLIAALALALMGPAATVAQSAGPRPALERSFVVVLDPGHGGDNGGCVGFDGHAREKEVSLALALELADELHRRLPRARIVLTRDRDRTLPLAERVSIANAERADLFISLHANASETRAQEGFETYVVDVEASGREAARVARRENDGGLLEPASSDARSEVATMLRQLEMSRDRAAAVRLASTIQRKQRERFPERVDRGVKQAPFDVLLGARMPAILFEAGFLDHAKEGALLLDEGARARMVDGLADAIVEHYRATGR